MTFSFARMGAVAFGLALMVPQAYAADAKDPVVATVNGSEIHESQLRDVYMGLPPQVQKQVQPRQLVEYAISNKLVTDEARKEKLDSDPEVKKSVKMAEDQFVRAAWQKKKAMSITDDQLKKRYDEWAPTFKPEEQIHAHHILVETEDEAKAIIADLKSGANFEEIAKTKSKDPNAARNGGDLGFFAKAEMIPEFSDAAFALNVGQITQIPVKTHYGYHVIRLDEKRMSSLPAFAEVKEEIRRSMVNQVIQESLKALHDKAKIDIKMADAPASAAPAHQ